MSGRRQSRAGNYAPRWPFARNQDSWQAQGLVGWWPMAPFGGTRLRDLSGRLAEGTLTNMEPEDWQGNYFGGQALNFGGTNQYVELSPMAHLAMSSGTISWWQQATVDNLGTTLSVSATGANTGFWILTGNGATATLTNELITFVTNNAGVVTNRVGYTTATRTELFDGLPHHIVAVGTGSAYALYLDGRSRTLTVGSGANDGEWTDRASVNRAKIGAVELGGGLGIIQHLTGRVWDMRVYDRPLSATEAFQLYEPSTRWDLYYETGRRLYSFKAPAAAGGLFVHPAGVGGGLVGRRGRLAA